MLTLSGCTAGDHEGVAIYLIANDIRPHQLSTLNHLELADSPFLTEEEIVSYRPDPAPRTGNATGPYDDTINSVRENKNKVEW